MCGVKCGSPFGAVLFGGFIGYLTMYLIRKNFNIAQNDMISTYGLSMTELGMITGFDHLRRGENAGFLLR